MGIFSWLFRSQDEPKNSYHFSGLPFVFGRSATSCLRISRERKRACARASRKIQALMKRQRI